MFFGLEDLSRAGEFIRSMFVPGAAGFVDTQAMYLLRNYAVILVILAFAATDLPKRIADLLLAGTAAADGDATKERTVAGSVAATERKLSGIPEESAGASGVSVTPSRGRLVFATVARTAYLVLVFLVAMAYVVDATYNPFLYLRF